MVLEAGKTKMVEVNKAERDAVAQVLQRLASDIDEYERNLLPALPPKQQTAVILHYAIDLPIAEVAVVMGCADGTVKAHLAKARASLRSGLETRDE